MGFLIASSGRCGTMALCQGLDRFSDHTVAHEPAPNLLEEAWLKHTGALFETETFRARLQGFASRAAAREAYGESFRAPNLLAEIYEAAPETRFLIIVRDPLGYIPSAHSKRVFRKHNDWDRWRIVPPATEVDLAALSLAEKLAWHWMAVNSLLLDFAETSGAEVRVVLHGELRERIGDWAIFLGLKIVDPTGLAAFLTERPNASVSSERPEGFDADLLRTLTSPVWERAQRAAEL
ncbi:MAG: hypothetical protein AB8G23_23160 [Myxococcota bacterium]